MKSIVFNEIKKILECDFVLENPKDKNLAHFATPLAFSLAKELKKSPVLIANDLASKFANHVCFESVQAVNGYLNFKISKAFLNKLATKALKQPNAFTKGEKKQESFLLEYVSANPTGPLHIGHARGAVFGDTLARLARHLGYRFDTEYYVNDAGNQIYLLGLSVLLSVKENILKEKVNYPEQYYKGRYIVDLAKEAFEKFGEQFFSQENIAALASWAKDKMLFLIKKNLEQAKIKIDTYANESSYYDALNATLNSLKEHKGIYEKEGKIWLASSQKGDEKDRVIIREDGRGTYLAADIVYHKDKMSRSYDKCINIWGADHHGYIFRIKAAMEFLGFNPDNLEIILAQMVSLLKDGEPYKMSKRAGNFILMSDVIEEIGSDALRYIFLSKKCDTHLEFDISDLQKQDNSNPVYYINYAHARIHQVFAKAGKKIDDVIDANLQSLNQDGVNLLFEALNLKTILNDAFEARALQKIPDYLKNLAASFHKFYNENKVIGSINENDLLKLFALIALSIKTAFALMGIEAKDKMEH
ncbi:arginine--tRNA ligase [Campylobacter sp. VicNov18]|uniref:arginine--tRNA ligase n=1 Tax=Campylobacter bilis TaxID=2691918 RepID=UPI00130DFC6D|nr:arginine--tRNA ligase [Campylobacter bilis]MPV63195.1 arginine--tRNA ligase [Campylobacter hepaticus]MBM0636695.1 arginine--tRNA ligase [Campylobacter bilis]MCC8277539.1 arginine--tRNA ligase [Campylobacter bilis]MCC8298744.1 arginine--tRNA ligase [Campylobacter bilis]MCC8300448.1 arginine--tRNA ligase [Campylobacter bilis]